LVGWWVGARRTRVLAPPAKPLAPLLEPRAPRIKDARLPAHTYFPAVGTVEADSAADVAGTTSIAPYLCSMPHRRRASRAS
jgi:hypothetical protein